MTSLEETRAAYRKRAALLRREFIDKMSTLAAGALGLVAALAWNNAVQALFRRYYPAPDDPGLIVPLFGYALVITVIAVIVMLSLSRLAARLKSERAVPAPRTPSP